MPCVANLSPVAIARIRRRFTFMAEPPNVRLTLSSKPENVVLVREMLSGIAASIALHDGDLGDIRTAVTEACNNVVLHAYPDADGPLEVEVRVARDTLQVLVRDRGVGVGSGEVQLEEGQRGEGQLGIGLTVIDALARHVEIRDGTGDGTEVRMDFAVPGVSPVEPSAPPGASPADLPAAAVPGVRPRVPAPSLRSTQTASAPARSAQRERAPAASELEVTIAPARLARAILPRLLIVLAARAHFSTDRISDTQLLADALLAQTAAVGPVDIALGVAGTRRLELRLGPLVAGEARKILQSSHVDGLGAVLDRLADGHAVTAAADGEPETLVLLLSDDRLPR
jgi:serine/threonine-protein kinase RsbW